jgi:transposase InsO family protein
MDFITDLPPSASKGTVFDSIMVIVDRYTKMSLYIPVKKTITAEEMATVFLRRVVRYFGVPKGIVLDQGSVFTSKFWSSLCFYLQVKRRLSTAFHPQTDG